MKIVFKFPVLPAQHMLTLISIYVKNNLGKLGIQGRGVVISQDFQLSCQRWEIAIRQLYNQDLEKCSRRYCRVFMLQRILHRCDYGYCQISLCGTVTLSTIVVNFPQQHSTISILERGKSAPCSPP